MSLKAQTLFYQHYSFSKHVYQKSVEELAWYDKPGHDGGRHQELGDFQSLEPKVTKFDHQYPRAAYLGTANFKVYEDGIVATQAHKDNNQYVQTRGVL